MPRTARIDAPGLVHHVIARGIEKRRIFLDDADRSCFVRRLGAVLPECRVDCLGWALMPNHVHLILRTGPVPLATAMARLLTGYASYFNRQHARVGHLFQNRYRSIPVESEEYLLTLVRYVHRNPLRAGIVGDLAELSRFPWTGYASLMGERTASFQAVGEVLDRFGSVPSQARKRLAVWMDDEESPPEDESVAPPSEPFEEAVGDLQARVCRELGLDPASFGSRRGLASDARAAVVYLARAALRLPTRDVATALGLSVGAVRKAARRGSGLIGSRPVLARLAAAYDPDA
jgi:REP element-mobilizing transposase RayT